MIKSWVYYYLLDKRSEIKFDLITCLFSRIDWRQLNSKKSYSPRSNCWPWFKIDKLSHKSCQMTLQYLIELVTCKNVFGLDKSKAIIEVSLLSKIPKWPQNWPFKVKNNLKESVFPNKKWLKSTIARIGLLLTFYIGLGHVMDLCLENLVFFRVEIDNILWTIWYHMDHIWHRLYNIT